jgi:23S rRNA (uracil1939-C5)-methyltransferase
MTRKGKVIPIPDCPLHDERIQKTIALLSANLPGPESLSLVHYVQAGAQLVLVTDIVPREGLKWDEKLFRALLECGNDGIWLHINPHAHEKVFSRESWQFLFGRQRSMSSLNLIYGPMSYQQIIPAFYRHAITAARDFFDFRPGDGIADLYCGTGGSLVAWTLAGAEGIGIDINHEAVECARMNLVGTLVLRGKCAERLDQLDQWIVYKELKRFFLYTNPPKTGMEPEVLQWILNTSRPERIGYMSCHAATLSREIKQLSDGGYRVVQILPYDTYPRTHHLECLALLEKTRG